MPEESRHLCVAVHPLVRRLPVPLLVDRINIGAHADVIAVVFGNMLVDLAVGIGDCAAWALTIDIPKCGTVPLWTFSDMQVRKSITPSLRCLCHRGTYSLVRVSGRARRAAWKDVATKMLACTTEVVLGGQSLGVCFRQHALYIAGLALYSGQFDAPMPVLLNAARRAGQRLCALDGVAAKVYGFIALVGFWNRPHRRRAGARVASRFGASESSSVFEARMGNIHEAIDSDEAILVAPLAYWHADSIMIAATACRERLLAVPCVVAALERVRALVTKAIGDEVANSTARPSGWPRIKAPAFVIKTKTKRRRSREQGHGSVCVDTPLCPVGRGSAQPNVGRGDSSSVFGACCVRNGWCAARHFHEHPRACPLGCGHPGSDDLEHCLRAPGVASVALRHVVVDIAGDELSVGVALLAGRARNAPRVAHWRRARDK